MRQYFNPRSPHGERPSQWRYEPRGIRISIHAPAWGATQFGKDLVHGCHISIHAPAWGATTACAPGTPLALFQSTPPAWGATLRRSALRPRPDYFNPRPPHGERQRAATTGSRWVPFQSTPPAWGATAANLRHFILMIISIHAPRMGSDSMCLMRPARR